MPMPQHQQALLHLRRCGADASPPGHVYPLAVVPDVAPFINAALWQ
jgi:hypothetical protein